MKYYGPLRDGSGKNVIGACGITYHEIVFELCAGHIIVQPRQHNDYGKSKKYIWGIMW